MLRLHIRERFIILAGLLFFIWGLLSLAFITLFIITIVFLSKKKKVKGVLISTIVVFVLGLASLIGAIATTASYGDDNTSDSQSSTQASKDNSSSNENTSDEEQSIEDDSSNAKNSHSSSDEVSGEKKSALSKAETYSKTMHMSKAGIKDQLTSEYGDQFPEEAAQYAIDNLEVDYKDNALEKAKTYANDMDMSNDGIYDQLTSSYGEKFAQEQAQYAVDNL